MLAIHSQTSACHACGHGLAAEALFCPNCGTAKQRDLTEDPLIGARVGERYLLVERVGMGASGTIYRGEHVTLRRKVCVKVLHHELSRDDLAIERFRRQATTVSDLENEHIVAVHDFGRAPDGRLYIAMEYLEGETLDERIAGRGHLEVDDAVSILTQLGEALIEAHAIGYVHRDLRPRNLFLAVRRGSANFLKLLDFGLSKLVASEGSADSTSLGMTFGDPHYMSPEQARGEPVDRRADIYSMGCIAYQMFTGEPPFTGGKVFTVLSRHVEEAPIPLSERVNVPAWVSSTVMRCLAKDPNNRFATVYRLVEALREGTISGKVMDDDRAVRRETTQPASVSRVIERLSDRLGADGQIDDADATREGFAGAALPAIPNKDKPFDGSRTALGVPAPVNAGVVRASLDSDATEPSSAPIISGETPGAIPSHVANDPTPPPRSRDLPAVVVRSPSGPLGTPVMEMRRKSAPTEAPAPIEAESFDDDYYYDNEVDEKVDENVRAEDSRKISAAGKRARRGSAGDSGLGISSAWYADGDALENSQLSLNTQEMEKLERARARRVSRPGASATGELYLEESEGKLKWVVAVLGAAALAGLAIFLLTRGDDKPSSEGAEVAAAETQAVAPEKVASTVVRLDAGAPVFKDGAPAATKVVETPVKPRDVKPRDVKPRDAKPVDAKPVDVEPVEPKEPVVASGDGDGDTEKEKKPSAEDKKRANFFAQVGSKALSGGDIPGAAKEFRRALALNPSNSRAITGLGEIALKQGSYSAAVKHLSRAAKMRSRSARVHTLLGDARLGAGDRSGASASYLRALEIDPDYARAQRGLNRAGG